MKTAPLVTVVIPTYNYSNKIKDAIKSLQAQTVSNFECFIIDDGSTDNSEEVIRTLIEHDQRFHYQKQKNSGVAVARNHGISLGKAPYVCCLDADDALEPQFLEACVMKLSNEREYSIAYTSLKYVLPNGKMGVSPWPGEFDYQLQLSQQNQVPTCCVFRRVMWERLGGYRSRYCPHGAGSEDAEFWLRAGAHGFKAVRATDAPLFIYSFLSGNVSGNKNYTEINWIGQHPWTKDMRHPFPSVAKPRRQSHPVHQYDNPVVSVIIPVGPGHGEMVFDALDSLESQTFRDWEVIIVDDTGSSKPWDFDGFPDALRAYPYVRKYTTSGKRGAGYARNLGASYARAPFLLFLDADDALVPEALEEMIIAWGIEHKIIYSDYAGKAYVSAEEVDKNKSRVIYYDEKTGISVLRHNSAEFECEKAVLEPSQNLYIWNLISSLVPKVWHEKIGGFDETMSAWEDWDYWIRMAHAGYCFYHIRKPLVVYRFYTGTRRQDGLRDYENLIKYMQTKYHKADIMPCNCGGRRAYSPPPPVSQARQTEKYALTAERNKLNMLNNSTTDQDFVLIYYDHPNRGQHKVVGVATRTNYGYRAGGDRFYVNRLDISAQPNLFKIIESQPVAPVEQVVAPPPPPPAAISSIPVQVEEKDREEAKGVVFEASNLDTVPGLTPGIRAQLNEGGVHSIEELVNLGEEGLLSLKGVGKARAATIFNFAKEYQEKHSKEEDA